jgi:hypothetical protein
VAAAAPLLPQGRRWWVEEEEEVISHLPKPPPALESAPFHLKLSAFEENEPKKWRRRSRSTKDDYYYISGERTFWILMPVRGKLMWVLWLLCSLRALEIIKKWMCLWNASNVFYFWGNWRWPGFVVLHFAAFFVSLCLYFIINF